MYIQKKYMLWEAESIALSSVNFMFIFSLGGTGGNARKYRDDD